MLLWIYFCESPIYGEESPYFDNFSAKQRFDSPPNTEYIFFQLAVNVMQNCRLKIAISL